MPKLTDRTELGAPLSTDIFHVVSNPTTSPLSHWVTLENIGKNIYELGTLTSLNVNGATSLKGTTIEGSLSFPFASEVLVANSLNIDPVNNFTVNDYFKVFASVDKVAIMAEGAETFVQIGDTTEENRIITLGKGQTTYTSFQWNDGVSVNAEIKVDADDNLSISAPTAGANILLSPTLTGNVGIGTLTPDEKLHVEGVGKFSTGLTSPKIYPLADAIDAFQITKADGSTPVLNVDTTNRRIGINRADPAYSFHLGQIDIINYLAIGCDPIGTAGLLIEDGTGTTSSIIQDNNSGELKIENFKPNSNIIINVDGTGKVGVGVPAPTEKFDVAGTGKFSTGLISPKIYPLVDAVAGVQINKADGTSNILTVDTVNSRLGIGTNAPARKLDLRGDQKIIAFSTARDAWDTAQILMEDPTDVTKQFAIGLDTVDHFVIVQGGDVGTGWLPLSLNPRGGNVGIGLGKTETPLAALDLPASTAGRASFRIRSGDAPTSPFDGDMWYNSEGLRFNFNGEIKHVAPKDLVYVYSLDDLPPVQPDGYIHLEEKHYVIMEQITLDRNAVPSCKGFYLDAELSPQITGYRSIEYKNQEAATTDEALFKSDDIGGALIIIEDLNVYTNDLKGRLFNINSTDPTGILLLKTVAAGGFYELGTIETISYFGVVVNYVQCGFGGLVLKGNSAVAVQSHRFNDWLGTLYGIEATFLTIEGTQENVQINNNFFQPIKTDTFAEKSLYIDPEMTTSGGSMVGNAFDLTNGGEVFQSGSKDQTDPYWTYAGNTNVPDSTVYSEITVVGNTRSTDFPATNAWIELDIDPTKITVDDDERMTNAGIVDEYLGLEGIKLNMEANATFSTTSTNKFYFVSFAYIDADATVVTYDNTNNLVLETATPRQNGDSLRLSTTGTLPTGLQDDALYYVVEKTTDNFKLSFAPGGTPVTFTTNGTGTNTYNLSALIDASDSAEVSSGTPVKLKPSALQPIETNYKITLMAKTESTPIISTIITDLYIKKFKI